MRRRQLVSALPRAATLLAAPALVRHALADEPGLAARTLTIGCSAAMTGPLASFGKDIQQGAEAAMAQINARGGIHGRTLRLQLVDDGYVPQRTADNVKKMLSQGSAFALLSCVGTPNNTAILPLVEEAGIPYVAPWTGASSLRQPSRNVFHVRASYTTEVNRLVQRLAGMGLKSIGIVHLDNGYGREMLEDATRALAGLNMKPALQLAVATDGKNLADVVDKAAGAHPSALLLATAGTVSADLVRGLRKSAPGMLLSGLSVTLPHDSLARLGEDARGLAMTMVVPSPHLARLQLVRDYQAAMRANRQQEFSLGSLEAYVNTRVLAEGLERAGRDPGQARLRTALAGIRQWDLGGFAIDYGSQAPYVGSGFIDLGVLGTGGRLLG
ncbi:MAG: ABC transporter substrate-binding protein [Burkholderiaceae bacterium]|jgi:ABC-type branched-subunit amino acid transport system substrate-binding protein|nr:ABC transporter substrate-binding protein [Burkholderiaceae bacterium]